MIAPTALLLIDGDCGFCRRSAQWLERRFVIAVQTRPWQSLSADEIDQLGRTTDELSTQVWFSLNGQLLGGDRAITAALGACRGVWPLVGRIVGAPPISWLSPLVYRQIARNRWRLPGSTCSVSAE